MQRRLSLPKSVIISDKTLRDGIQPEEKSIPTQTKIFIANALVDAGFHSIEISQYLPMGQDLPQFHDVSEVLKGIRRKPGVECIGLAGCKKGVDLAVEDSRKGFGLDWLNITLSDSEEMTKQIFNTTYDALFDLIQYALQSTINTGIKVRASLMVSWVKPLKFDRNFKIIEKLRSIGITQIDHTDPYGNAIPSSVSQYFAEILNRFPDIDHCFHCHDVKGLGMANYLAAMEAGISRFDTAMGGIGGFFTSIIDDVPTPAPGTNDVYIPSYGKTGLVTTEDFVLMCNEMGIETGINFDKLLNLGKWVEKIIGRRLWSLALPWGKS